MKIERTFSRSGITLPKFWPADTEARLEKTTGDDTAITTSDSKQTRSRASFATSRSAFGAVSKNEYDDYFRLDNCADMNVCNDLSRFTNYKGLHDEIIRFGDTKTQVEGKGNVAISIQTPGGRSVVQLTNVAHVPGFHWNLISTHALEEQGLYLNTRTCWMEYSDGSKAFQVQKHGAFRVVEPNSDNASIRVKTNHESTQAFATAKISRAPQTAAASMDVWHARLGHIHKEALQHVPKSTKGVILNTHDFQRNTNICPACELAQAHQQVSRVPTWRGTYPFEKVHMDLIDMDEAFNADSWVVHFYYDHSAYHISFNRTNKTQEELVSVTREFLAITNDNWGFTTRYLRSDGERGLGSGLTRRLSSQNGTRTGTWTMHHAAVQRS